MVEVDFSSKDLARIKYLFDKYFEDKTKIDWQNKYERLKEKIEAADLMIDDTYEEVFKNEMDEYDEKLRWKLEIIHDAKHKEELEEEIEEE